MLSLLVTRGTLPAWITSPSLPPSCTHLFSPFPTVPPPSACHFDRVSSAFGQHVDAIFNLWHTIWTRICLNCRTYHRPLPLLSIHDGMSVNKSNQIKSHEFDFSLCVCVCVYRKLSLKIRNINVISCRGRQTKRKWRFNITKTKSRRGREVQAYLFSRL